MVDFLRTTDDVYALKPRNGRERKFEKYLDRHRRLTHLSSVELHPDAQLSIESMIRNTANRLRQLAGKHPLPSDQTYVHETWLDTVSPACIEEEMELVILEPALQLPEREDRLRILVDRLFDEVLGLGKDVPADSSAPDNHQRHIEQTEDWMRTRGMDL